MFVSCQDSIHLPSGSGVWVLMMTISSQVSCTVRSRHTYSYANGSAGRGFPHSSYLRYDELPRLERLRRVGELHFEVVLPHLSALDVGRVQHASSQVFHHGHLVGHVVPVVVVVQSVEEKTLDQHGNPLSALSDKHKTFKHFCVKTIDRTVDHTADSRSATYSGVHSTDKS